MKIMLLVFFGGGIGCVFRYAISLFVQKFYTGMIPLATYFTNIIGCFLIGILFGFIEKKQGLSPEIKYVLITGFCGGFTTFSAFGIETLRLFQNQHYVVAGIYVVSSVLVGILAVWLGLFVTK